MRSLFFALGVTLLSVGCASTEPTSEDEPVSEALAALAGDEDVIVYKNGVAVPESELVELNPADFGGIVGPDVTWLGRIDLVEGGLMGGVWQASHGSFAVLYPGALHGTVHVGHMILTDEAGSHRLGPGDSFLVTRGTLLEYEVEGPMVQASWVGNFDSPHAPGPITVYRKGSGAASEDELSYIGDADDFNATVLDGDLQVSARVDYLAGPTLAGIFEATRSTSILDPVIVTEHGAVLRGGMEITDEDGEEHRVRAGDSFILKRGSRVRWEIKGQSVQETFFSTKAL